MPLLFAATLFVSASLLFMIQPMVGKMVLPLLGGSPAVWNACMVFFQALLLLGYLYAHNVSARYKPRQQWFIHLAILGLPLGAFALAVAFGARHTPIAIAESLAPGDESSPILSVLLLLTVAIGVPFFVVSTSAPLLQKWFTCTGHPSARDPYFLYSASNFGSMISLLGYPLFIEPYLTITEQAWVFAVGFAALAVLIALCGMAAANPIGVPPSIAQQLSSNKTPPRTTAKKMAESKGETAANSPEGELTPTLLRKLKWITLAFVPSSLMLGVTFYMTTDIASIPLLWVCPLALYLVTFIVAFARLPDWFRVVIGNVAPVMILLLVFVLLSSASDIGITIMLHLLTFFAAALMCHYELARDRPSPKYLTEFFLLMSVGGVLGGIFNSLLAPLIFRHAYEYRIVLVLACLMVPRLVDETSRGKDDETDDEMQSNPPSQNVPETPNRFGVTPSSMRAMSFAFDFLIPIAIGVIFYFMEQLPYVAWFVKMRNWLAENVGVSKLTVQLILIYAVPVMVCFFFVDRPLRFGLAVAAILGYPTYREYGSDGIHSERSFFGILKIEETVIAPSLVWDRKFTDETMADLRAANVPESVVAKLSPLSNSMFDQESLDKALIKILSKEELEQWKPLISRVSEMDKDYRLLMGKTTFRRLVHGTTLHGTQIYQMENNFVESFQLLTALNPLENVVVACAKTVFDPRQEPLTYYHRTGPVGGIVHELRTRKGGADAKAPFAMVGLGTGSASCYAMPGQHLTFYEIDPAVRHLTYDSRDYFSYVKDAEARGAILDIQMGDARLKLKENVDRKYALLLVDAFSSDSIPVHLLTREAVQLYFDRMTDDGLLALHISNKYVRLEPVVGAIARDLGVVGRVWNDDSEGRPGKTASSWVVLARKREHLGQLYSPIGDLPFDLEPDKNGDERMNAVAIISSSGDYYRRSYMESPLTDCLANEYSSELEKKNSSGKTKVAELNEADKPREAWLAWLREKVASTADPREKERLALYITLIDKFDIHRKLGETMLLLYGHAFRRLEVYRQVYAWKDDYSDVMRVMTIPELQSLRKFFGLPTPIER